VDLTVDDFVLLMFIFSLYVNGRSGFLDLRLNSVAWVRFKERDGDYVF